MKHLILIAAVLLCSFASYSQAKQSAQSDSAKIRQLLREEAKPVYIKAYTDIHTLLSEISLAKKGLMKKSDVVDHYNNTVGAVMGQKETFEAVDKRVTNDGDAYIEAVTLREMARLGYQHAAELSYKHKQ